MSNIRALEQALEQEREIVQFISIPDRMFCSVCHGTLDPVIVGGQYKVPIETGFSEYVHSLTGLGGCPYAGDTFLVKLHCYEAVKVEGNMTPQQCVEVLDRMKGQWKKEDDMSGSEA